MRKTFVRIAGCFQFIKYPWDSNIMPELLLFNIVVYLDSITTSAKMDTITIKLHEMVLLSDFIVAIVVRWQ